jgi:hypothetical protein
VGQTPSVQIADGQTSSCDHLTASDQAMYPTDPSEQDQYQGDRRLYTGQSRDADLYHTKFFAPMSERSFFFSFDLSYIGEPSEGPSAGGSDASFQVS